MINRLDLAIALSKRFREAEVTVSRQVFLQVIGKLAENGHGQARLNESQSSPAYPFVHKANWQGITFLYFSREALSDRLPEVADVCC